MKFIAAVPLRQAFPSFVTPLCGMTLHSLPQSPLIPSPLPESDKRHHNIVEIQRGRCVQPAHKERHHCGRSRKQLKGPHPIALPDFENQEQDTRDEREYSEKVKFHIWSKSLYSRRTNARFFQNAAKIPTFRDISSAYDVYFHGNVIFTFLSLFLHSEIGRFAAA